MKSYASTSELKAMLASMSSLVRTIDQAQKEDAAAMNVAQIQEAERKLHEAGKDLFDLFPSFMTGLNTVLFNAGSLDSGEYITYSLKRF